MQRGKTEGNNDWKRSKNDEKESLQIVRDQALEGSGEETGNG